MPFNPLMWSLVDIKVENIFSSLKNLYSSCRNKSTILEKNMIIKILRSSSVKIKMMAKWHKIYGPWISLIMVAVGIQR